MSENIDRNIPAGGTSAHRPDLNWSQVRETILMLGLAVSQIRDSLTRGEESIGTLTTAFTTLAEEMSGIQEIIGEIPDESLKNRLFERTAVASTHVHAAIVAFQFYDRLTQRLDHVCHSIDNLGGLIAEPGRLFNPTEWVTLQQHIQSKYTMPEERMMFELIMQGVSIQEALSRSKAEAASKEEDGGLELF